MHIVRMFVGTDGQPTYAMLESLTSDLNFCAVTGAAGLAAYPVDPANVTPLNDGSKIGGWLGQDGSGTTCWTLPGDPAYATYTAYLTLSDATDLGDSVTLSCEDTSTPTPPSSGTTYASGCPAITPDATGTMVLVAD